MGSAQSRGPALPEPNSDAIERYYAALEDDRRRVIEIRQPDRDVSNTEQSRLLDYDNHANRSSSELHATENDDTESIDSSVTIGNINSQAQIMRSFPFRAGSMSHLDQATVYLAQAVSSTNEARNRAIQVLKNMDIKIVAQAIFEWSKAHAWEINAIVMPLILLACTPGLLGLLGFGAGGIAAGSIAAGIQAGIGNVAAGSVFAVLTSAGMGGFGVPIVLGGVLAVSSAVCWSIVAARKWWRGTKAEEKRGS